MKNKILLQLVKATFCLAFLFGISWQAYAQINCPTGWKSTRVGYTTFASESGVTGSTPYCVNDILFEGIAEESFRIVSPSVHCQNANLNQGLGNGNYTIVGDVSSAVLVNNNGEWPLASTETDGTFIINPTNNDRFATYDIGGLNVGQTYRLRVQVRIPNALWTDYNCGNQGTRPRITISRRNGDSGGGGGITNATVRTTVAGSCTQNQPNGSWDANNGGHFDMHPGRVVVFEADYTVGGNGGTQWTGDDGFQVHFAFQSFPNGATQLTTLAIDYIEVIGCVRQEITSSQGLDPCEGMPTILTATGLGATNDVYEWRENGVLMPQTGFRLRVLPTVGTTTTYTARNVSDPSWNPTAGFISVNIMPVSCCGAGASRFTIPKICMPVNIDGLDTDDAWNMAPWQTVNQLNHTEPGGSGVGVRPAGRFRMLYDDEYIYLYAQVYDDRQPYNSFWTGNINVNEGNGYMGDALEIYLDAGTVICGGNPLQVGLTYPTNAIAGQWIPGRYRNQACNVTFTGLEALVDPWVGGRTNELGQQFWGLEVRFPANANGVDLTGDFIRMEIGIAQSNTTTGTSVRGALFHTWPASTGDLFQRLDRLHEVLLSDCASAVATPESVCDGGSTVLSTQMKSATLGLPYIWQQAPTRTGPWSPAVITASGDAENNFVTVTPATTTWYRALYDVVETCPVEVVVAFTTAGTTTSSPQNLCVGSTLTLIGTASGTSAEAEWGWKRGGNTEFTGTWVTGPSNNIADRTFSKTVAVTDAGDYYFVILDACEAASSVVTVSIITANTIDVDTNGKNRSICINTAISPNIIYTTTGATGATFSGLPAGVSGTWRNDSIIISGTPTTAVGSPFNHTITLTGGCGGGTETGTVTVNAKPTVTIGSNTPVCEGATLNLNSTGSTGAGTYAWSGPNSFTATTAAPSINNVTTAASGTYKLVITSAAGCKDSTTTTVTVNAKPTVTVGSNSPVCEGETLNLNSTGSTGAGTYTWSGPNSFTNTTAAPSINNVTTAASGTYKLVITSAAGCKDSTTTTVTVNAKPTVTIDSNTPVCEGETLNLNSTGSTGAGTYSWSGPNSFTNTTAAPSINNVTTAASGTYKLVITSAAGCKDSTTTSITINPKPDITIAPGSTGTVNIGGTTQLQAGGLTGTWTSGNASIATVDASGEVTGVGSGTVEIYFETTPEGCRDTIEITVSSIGPIKPGYTQYFCPGDTPTLIGGGQNIDKWQWCIKGDPLSCLGVSTNLADTLLTLPALTAADDGTIWVFYAYDTAQTDTLQQEITLTKRPDFAFDLTNPTPVCKDANEIITATTTIAPIPANIQYAWGSGGFAGSNTTTLPTSTVGLGQKLFVRGKADNYCEKLDSITYDVVFLSVTRKGTWASTVYDSESVTLRLDTAGTVLPTGGKIEYVWEISSNPASTWSPLTTTLVDSIINIPPSGGACYRVTATMYDALNTPVCLPYQTQHCVGVTTLVIGRDTTYYYCPDTSTLNTLALTGTAKNIDAYAWYQEGDSEPVMTNPTDPRIIYLSPAPGDVTDTKTLIGADVTASIWYFKVFSGANDAKQTFTIIKHDDYSFDVASNLVDFPNPVFACVGNNVTLTATATSGMPAANRNYSWNGGAASSSAVYPLPTSTTTPIARPDTVSVTGEIRPAVLSPGDRTSRYCPTTAKIPYTIGNLNVEKSGTWASVVCKDNGTTLTLTDNASTSNETVAPAGTEVQIRWYSSPNGSNPWTPLSTYNNQLSLSTGNLTATIHYRIEVSLIRTSDQRVICSQTDITHTITVPVFTMGVTANHTNQGYCIGDNMLLTGTGTGGTTFQWFKDGNPIIGATSLTYSKTFAASDAGTYKFKAMNGSCADSITINISENAAFNFSVPNEVTVCQESGTTQIPATNQTGGATGITYNWSATNGATGTGSTFNFPINTAGTGTITVIGKATDYCATTKTIPYTIVGLTLSYIQNPTNICANSLTPAVLEVGVNGTVPLGITYDIVWEKQEASNWQTVGNGTTLSVNPPITTTYRATLIIKDAANDAMCSRHTTPHTLNVLDLRMGPDDSRTICEGDVLSLEGTTGNGVEGAWLDANRNMIQSWTSLPAGRYLYNQYPTDNTTYYFLARNGVCIDEQKFDITVRKNIQFIPVPPIINTCVNTPVMLNTNVSEPTNGIVNYNWVVDGVLMGTGPTFEFIGKTAKTGSIVIQALETATHCGTTQIVDYTVNEIVVLETNYPSTFCPNEPVTLEARFEERPAGNIPTYRWYENNTLMETGSGTHALKSFNPTNDAVYRLEVNTAACATPVVIIQTTIEMVKMDIVLPKDTTICPGEEILILAITEAQGNFSIRWTKQGESDSIPIPMIQTGIFFRERPTEQTRYTAFFTNTGCFNTASFVVSMHPVPIIVAIEEMEPRHVRFYVESGTQPYEFAVNQQTYFTFNDESGRLPIGSNIVYVRDANLCRTSMPFVMAEPLLVFPPFFTPNGILDENRTWRVRGLELFDDIELIIFDRHGKELARRTRGEYAEWDGKYLGKQMPSTDYWFLLRVRETGREYTGHFTLIR